MSFSIRINIGCYFLSFHSHNIRRKYFHFRTFVDDFGYPNGDMVVGRLHLNIRGDWKPFDDIPF